jgi:hypothetical protein
MKAKNHLLHWLCAIFVSGVLCSDLRAQVNLVPNPSFEDTIACPTMFGQMDFCDHWSSYLYSPDYINSCNINGVGIPLNGAGFQYPFHGSAYSLLATADFQAPWNFREFIGVQLNQPTIPELKYYISFYYSRAYSIVGFITGATNNLGIRFLNQSYTAGTNPMPIDNFSHGKIDSICYDTTNWSRAFFEFQSDTSFQYLVIGNFYDNAHTDTFGFMNNSGGYYIDAVCLSTDSSFTANWTTIYENESNSYLLKNNIANNILIVYSLLSIPYEIYERNGDLILKGRLNASSTEIDVSSLENGIYFIRAGIYKNRFIICH